MKISRETDYEFLEEKTLAVFLGSFDPIHLGHEYVVEQVILQKAADYILIYPAPGNDIFKKRAPLKKRRCLLETLYLDKERAFITEMNPLELQQEFFRRLHKTKVVGVIGSDFLQDRLLAKDVELRLRYDKLYMRGKDIPFTHENDAIGALMAPQVSEFIVARRNGEEIPEWINDRKVISIIDSFPCSSTDARKAVRNGSSLSELVSPEINNQLIQKNDPNI